MNNQSICPRNEKELLRLTGSMQQVAYARPVMFSEGRASSLKACEVKNGPLYFRVLQDKCLDIEELSYKGVSFGFLSKPGLQGPGFYDADPQDATRSIMGGFMFTSGVDNICPPCESEGRKYPMHGRMRSTPAEHACADARWVGDEYVIDISGEMREAELFGENITIRRNIRTVYGQNKIILSDTVQNQALRPEPFLLLYHINIGYPMLNEGTRILLPSLDVQPRDAAAQGHEDEWRQMPAPADNKPEYVFIHQLAAKADGQTVACAINESLELGVRIEFSREALPYFMEWQSGASGDYALGLEPANASVYGRDYHARRGDLPTLEPLERRTFELSFSILDGKNMLEEAKAEVESIAEENA